MKTKIIEASNGRGNPANWGKFLVGRFDILEWSKRSVLPGNTTRDVPLLVQLGHSRAHIFVMDLQTCEGAMFLPGGYARADLEKHRIWVCPLFEPFLVWLYQQDLTELSLLPDHVELPDTPMSLYGYRRPGPKEKEAGVDVKKTKAP